MHLVSLILMEHLVGEYLRAICSWKQENWNEEVKENMDHVGDMRPESIKNEPKIVRITKMSHMLE